MIKSDVIGTRVMFACVGGTAQTICYPASPGIVNPVQSPATVKSGAAAGDAEGEKQRKHADLGRRFRFEPVAFETSGSCGPSTAKLLREIGGSSVRCLRRAPRDRVADPALLYRRGQRQRGLYLLIPTAYTS